MYGQMTAGSWIYIGTQGILQGTYETFAAVAAQAVRRHARRHADADRRARRHGRRAAARGHHERRRRARASRSTRRALDRRVETPLPRRGRRRPRRRARPASRRAKRERRPLSVGVLGNAAEVLPGAAAPRRAAIDIVTDQTSAHDPLAYLPIGVDLEDWADYARARSRTEFTDRARESMAEHVEAMVGLPGRRRRGLRLRQLDPRRGPARAASTGPSTSPASCPPTSGRCSARARARSGGRRCPATRPTSPPPTGRCSSCSRENEPLARWIRLAQDEGRVPGPAGPDLLARLRRARPGRACGSTRWSRRGELSAPIVIGRDHLDCGSVASPYRETEAMADGSDAIADWPLLNALVNTASGRHLGVDPPRRRRRHRPLDPRRAGDRRRRHARWPAQKIERVLTNDPGMGVIRHVDAGYDRGRRGRRRARGARSRCAESRRDDRRPTLLGRRSSAASAADAARAAATRRLRLRRAPSSTLREWFAERGRARAACDVETDAQRQPVGLVGRPGRRDAGSSPAATSTPCPAAAPTTARSAWCPALAAVDVLRASGVHAARPLARRRSSPRRRAAGSACRAWARGC